MATDPETVIDTGAPGEPIVTGEPNHEKPTGIDPTAFYDEAPLEGEEAPAEDALAEPEQEPIAVPSSWANEYKDSFGKLPRDLQEVVSRREAERERFVHQKSQEAAATRSTVEAEARQVLQQIHENTARAYEQAVGFIDIPQPPDPRLLNSEDPEHHRLYMVQQNRYQSAAAQQQQLQQSAEAARQQAAVLQSQELQLSIQENEAKMVAKWPEWSQPSERAKLVSRLQPIAEELGYGAEAQAQASAEDFFALDMAHGWKVKADKYDALMKQKMAPVRAAKQVPPATRAGSPVGASQPIDTAAMLYPDDQPRR